ncbi:hypothetical protein PCANC_00891 [Puccinia coronata f. sp. avenae]|uniref:Uncharacterized protein n=1 Tax=Puccinia coronata f. sp. avenae TaxID=200324 RepID=A0A2N5W7M3_9BASI|nr:hypothetical protein PCANC_00891 [Puccinia coronata f. sp. avenae]
MNSADFLAKPTGRCTIRCSLAAIGVVSPPEGSAHCLPTQSTPGCRITTPTNGAISQDESVISFKNINTSPQQQNGDHPY